jgi:hypothetical protein
MRRLIIILIATVLPCSLVLADDIENVGVYGDGFYPGVVCVDCRDPYEYPMDFVAFGYNAFFGEDAWLFASNLDWPFRIYNLDGDWVAVWFENILFDMPSLLPDLMQVMLRFENGQIVAYTVLQDGPDMPVGAESESEPESGSADCGCGDGEEGDDEYEESEEEWEWEWEESELTGEVEIVDPDEDGEFDDYWDEEL